MKNEVKFKLLNVNNSDIYIKIRREDFVAEGYMSDIHKFDKTLSFFTIFLSIFFVLVSLIFLTSQFFVGLVFLFLGNFLFLYSFYLRRDKNKFFNKLNSTGLVQYLESNQKLDINLLDFMDFDTLVVYDYLLKNYKSYNKSIYGICLYLFNNNFIKNFLLNRFNLDQTKISNILNHILDKNSQQQVFDLHLFSRQLLFIILITRSEFINLKLVLACFLKFYLNKILDSFDVLDKHIQIFISDISYQNFLSKQTQLLLNGYARKPYGTLNSDLTSVLTTTVNKFGIDLPQNQYENLIYFERGKEIQQIVQSIENDALGCCLILAKQGSGKSLCLNHLAIKILFDKVYKNIRSKRVVKINFSEIKINLAAQEEFLKVIQGLFKEANYKSNVILCIEDIDYIFNLGDVEKEEILQIVQNSIEEYKVKIIATADVNEITKYLTIYKSFFNLFEKVYLEEPSDATLEIILLNHLYVFEKKYKEHKIKVYFSVISRIIELKNFYNLDKSIPDKAINLLEEVFLYSIKNNIDQADDKLVDKIVSLKAGISVGFISQSESERLLRLEKDIHSTYVGQEHAVSTICNAIRRARTGIRSVTKPIASFLFYGPTGVGKTELSKAIARAYYGDENKMIRLDMSEFQEEQNIERLIGEIDQNGNMIGGFFVEALKKQPFSLVLLDEIEKANPKVLDLFLQVLDEGYLTDAGGNKVDFRNTIIVATSNIGAKIILNYKCESDGDYANLEKVLQEELVKHFRVEFLNRFDGLILFKKLSVQQVCSIVNNFLIKIKEILKDQDILFEWDQVTVEKIASLAYNPDFGARFVKRKIQELVENKISELIIKNILKSGKKIIFKELDYEVS